MSTYGSTSNPDPLNSIQFSDSITSLAISLCFNPRCQQSNHREASTCIQCGATLRLNQRYRATRLMGGGTFSRSYAAIDEHHQNQICVVKQFLPPSHAVDPNTLNQAIELFRQEASILQQLDPHPQIPSLLSFIDEQGYLYLIQEFVEGKTLFQAYTQNFVFDEPWLETLLKDLLPVLQYIHDHRIIHRDIKPGNIMQSSPGSVYLIDFGGAYQETSGRCGRVGTPGYAAPEQFSGTVYPSSDLYSLGVTCIRLLTRQLPDNSGSDTLFDAQAQQWLWQQAGVTIRPHLAQILDRLLQVPIEARYPSAAAVLRDLYTEARPRSIDYSHLQQLLAQQAYQSADQETWRILLQLGNCESSQQLSVNAIANIPPEDLRILDKLWQVASGGRFGFSAQQRLYLQSGDLYDFDYPRWQHFAAQVGWFKAGQWLQYEALDFSEDAPKGHLPASCVSWENRQTGMEGPLGWWRLGFITLMEQLSSA